MIGRKFSVTTMERSEFQVQIRRLVSTYNERAYPSERVELFWRAFKTQSALVFSEAVDECIGTQRQPPMFQELTAAVEQARLREVQRMQVLSARGYLGVLEDAAPKAHNPEFAAECVKLVRNFTTGRINRRQFDEGCGILEQVAEINRRK